MNDDAPTFEVFIRWLYHGSDGFKGVLGYSGQDYIKAWVLGDKIACPAFTKLMMSLVIRYYSDEWLKISDVQYVYNNSPAGSKLRSWALMQLWWDATLDGSPNVLSDLDVIMMETEDLACDLAKAVVRQGKPTRPSEEDELYQEVPT